MGITEVIWRFENDLFRIVQSLRFSSTLSFLLVSPRRDAAEEYVKSTWKADFTYFPNAENKARFGDYFSKSNWIKSRLVIRVFSLIPCPLEREFSDFGTGLHRRDPATGCEF